MEAKTTKISCKSQCVLESIRCCSLCKTVGLVDNRNNGLMDFWIVGLLELAVVRSSSHQSKNPLIHQSLVLAYETHKMIYG
jgi:hypothetical protein